MTDLTRIEEKVDDLRDRTARLETKMDGVMDRMDKHILVDSARLDRVEEELLQVHGFFKVSTKIGAALVGLVTIAVALKELFF